LPIGERTASMMNASGTNEAYKRVTGHVRTLTAWRRPRSSGGF
jgi:hypothetical protein